MFEKIYTEQMTGNGGLYSTDQSDRDIGPRSIDFQFYWRAFTTRKLPILLFTALVTGLSIYYAQTSQPVYSASATLLLEPQRANITSIKNLISTEQESIDYYGTQLVILNSRVLAERVLKQLLTSDIKIQERVNEMIVPSNSERILTSVGNWVIPTLTNLISQPRSGEAAPNAAEGNVSTEKNTSAYVIDDVKTRYTDEQFNKLLVQFKKQIRVKPVANSKLITIQFESMDPEFSALGANTIAEAYIKSGIERRNELKYSASKWMDNRVAELKIKLENSEDDLLIFKRKNGLIDLNGGVGRLSEQELLATSLELAEVKNQLSSATDMYRKIQSYKRSDSKLLETLPFVQEDSLFRSFLSSYGQAERDLYESRNRYGPKHPVIIDGESQLRSLRQTLDGHISRTVLTYESDYKLLQQRLASLESTLQKNKGEIQLLAQQKITLEALEREVAANREQYNGLFDRIIETRTTDGLDESNAVISEAAWIPANPIRPQKIFIIALALFGSFITACIISVIREFLDDTVKKTDDIERRLNTKILGVFPKVSRSRRFFKGRRQSPITHKEAKKISEPFLEAVNTCRTALEIKKQRQSGYNAVSDVLLVTSSLPNEGKSTVALNLAHAFGQLERTIIVDCDLRCPSIGKAIYLSKNTYGLTSMFTGSDLWSDVVVRNVLDSFDCLPCGPTSGQPIEILASEKFELLIASLKKNYSKIIIDSPPLYVVSDALVLSKYVDNILYVVKPNSTPIKMIHSGLSRLRDAEASIAGVCMSQVDLKGSQRYGELDFHGFGVNYQYGNYYKSADQG